MRDENERFSNFILSSYGFVGFDTEEAALLAVEKMDNAEFKG